jgi:hypothetical protein
MLAISLTLVVLISALVLGYQYATGALSPDEVPNDTRGDAREEPAAPAARAA